MVNYALDFSNFEKDLKRQPLGTEKVQKNSDNQNEDEMKQLDFINKKPL